jgi:O-antigen/teichoic acid export membrane protein
MLKRIVIIALLTGAAQVFSVFCLKILSATVSTKNMSLVAQADSSLQLLLTIIALGLQSATMRNIALSNNWKQEYAIAQSARGALSLFLLAFSISGFFWPANVIFLLAPLTAFSGDYALYAVGKSIQGAIAAFVRVVLPYGLMLLMAFISPGCNLIIVFVIGGAIAYAVTNYFIASQLQTPIFYKPAISNLKLYITSLPLGLVSLALYFIGLGVVLIMPFFYPDAATAVVFVGLKFYMIFKGVLRIIHQAYLKEMKDDHNCLRVDRLGIAVGLTFFVFAALYPTSFIHFFFGSAYTGNQTFFIIIALAALVYSFLSSITTKALLENKDHSYAIIASAAALVTILVSIILSFYHKNPTSVGLGILAGEIVFSLLMFLLLKTHFSIISRVKFMLQLSLAAMIPFSVKLIGADNISHFLIAIGIYTATLSYLYYKKIIVY